MKQILEMNGIYGLHNSVNVVNATDLYNYF